jgi:hypothetical protein
VNAVQVRGELRLECQYNRDLFDACDRAPVVARLRDLAAGGLSSTRMRPRSPAAGRCGCPRRTTGVAAEPVAFDLALQGPMNISRRSAIVRRNAPLRACRIQCRSATPNWSNGANGIAHALRSHGVRRGALVGIAVDRGVDMLAAVARCPQGWCGLCALDPQFPTSASPTWPPTQDLRCC